MDTDAEGVESNFTDERARDLVEITAGAPGADEGFFGVAGAQDERGKESEHGVAQDFEDVGEPAGGGVTAATGLAGAVDGARAGGVEGVAGGVAKRGAARGHLVLHGGGGREP